MTALIRAGTWIPPDRGLALSKQYMVAELLMPIIDYVPPAGASPPPAPKHLTAAPKGPRQKRTATPASVAPIGGPLPPLPPQATALPAASTSGVASRQARPPAGASRAPLNEHPVYIDSQLSKVEQFDDGDITTQVSEGAGSSASRTPSPFASDAGQSDFDSVYGRPSQQSGPTGRKRKHDRVDVDNNQGSGIPAQLQQQLGAARQSQGGPAVYARMILDYFVSESAQIPSFLISPPADFDPNVVIDDDGHTALHWACAMGRIRIVKLLLTAGADIFRANAMGQTALMRSVMFTNNYDLRKFPELFELLHRSTINIDRNDRTVFHYIVDIALQKGKAHAARYYLEVVLDRLKEYPREVADILNFQDEEGETALTLAARARSKNLVRILLNHGADPKITNRDGKSAEDYILEDERFRSAEQQVAVSEIAGLPTPEQVMQQVVYPTQIQPSETQAVMAIQQPNGYYTNDSGQIVANSVHQSPTYPIAAAAAVQVVPQQLHFSETGHRTAAQVIPQMSEQLDALASAYDAELQDKERDIAQAHAMLASIQAEVVEDQRQAAHLRTQADTLEACKAKEQQLQFELQDKMGKRFRVGWEKYVRDEDEKQRKYISINRSDQPPTVSYSNGGLAHAPADLQSLYAPLPAVNGQPTDANLQAAIQTQYEALQRLRHVRKDLFENFAKLQADAGTGDKISQYRKLIALGCGMNPQEVDDVLIKNLLESLDNGDDSALMAPPTASQESASIAT